MLSIGDLSAEQADAIVTMLTDCEIWNLFNKDEVTTMLNEGLDKIIEKHDKIMEENDKKWDQKHKELLANWGQEHREYRRELRSDRRWMVGTIITCTLALAGYLSALIHLSH
ncbi:MAG: hypothetical protein K0U29_04215 [Gammaproteobacteria bacterium]|nr:hypothetical protein [Gammaproteobacteria bacterium]